MKGLMKSLVVEVSTLKGKEKKEKDSDAVDDEAFLVSLSSLSF